MERMTRLAIGLTIAALLTGCGPGVRDKPDPLAKTVIDDANLIDLMLTAGDPKEAIAYFERALGLEPDRVEFRRGLAFSLKRAKRYPEAARIYQEMIAVGQADPNDRMEYAVIAMRTEKWDEVRSVTEGLPAGLNTGRRHMLDALLADHDSNWEAADAAYARAETLSTNPAVVLNNWGVSLMARGDLPSAVKTFERALTFNSQLFSAKNNLAISRGLQGVYQLPIIPMTETEKAIIMHNLGLIALRKGEKKIAKGLFVAAVETHPQHYAAAATQLAALDTAVEN